MDEYNPSDFLWERMDYSKQYFPSDRIFLVTGHTPTMMIREDKKLLVYQENGHIALDCGCVFGGNLAAYCIETGEITYVPHRRKCGLSISQQVFSNERKGGLGIGLL